MKRNSKRKVAVFAALAAILSFFSFMDGQLIVPRVAAQGATQTLLDSNWDAFSDSNGDGLFGPLAQPLGKVIYNQPAGRNKLAVTFILQDASPSTNYTVGLDIFGPAPCGGSPATFGVPRDVCADGTVGGVTASAGVYPVGTLTSDTDGDGSLHVNLNSLPSGPYSVLFWVIPCTPPTACGYFPQASTGSWGVGPFEVISIP